MGKKPVIQGAHYSFYSYCKTQAKKIWVNLCNPNFISIIAQMNCYGKLHFIT